MSEIAQTPEAVALRLVDMISSAEGQRYDRQYTLDLYAECLKAAKGNRILPETSGYSGDRPQVVTRRTGRG